jgi:hypothetical protein
MTPRDQITADITSQVRNEIDDVLAEAPERFENEELDAIEKQVLAHTSLVLDALSASEIQSQSALDRHIAQAIAETRRLIHAGRAQ